MSNGPSLPANRGALEDGSGGTSMRHDATVFVISWPRRAYAAQRPDAPSGHLATDLEIAAHAVVLMLMPVLEDSRTDLMGKRARAAVVFWPHAPFLSVRPLAPRLPTDPPIFNHGGDFSTEWKEKKGQGKHATGNRGRPKNTLL